MLQRKKGSLSTSLFSPPVLLHAKLVLPLQHDARRAFASSVLQAKNVFTVEQLSTSVKLLLLLSELIHLMEINAASLCHSSYHSRQCSTSLEIISGHNRSSTNSSPTRPSQRVPFHCVWEYPVLSDWYSCVKIFYWRWQQVKCRPEFTTPPAFCQTSPTHWQCLLTRHLKGPCLGPFITILEITPRKRILKDLPSPFLKMIPTPPPPVSSLLKTIHKGFILESINVHWSTLRETKILSVFLPIRNVCI